MAADGLPPGWYERERPLAGRGRSGWRSAQVARFFRNRHHPDLVVVEAQVRRKDGPAGQETIRGWAAYRAGEWRGFERELAKACVLAERV